MTEEIKPVENNDDIVTLSKEEFNKLKGSVVHYEKTFAGIDPEKYKATLEENEIFKKNKATGGNKDFEEHLNKVNAEWGGKYQTLEQQLESIKKENHEIKVVDGVLTKIGSSFIDSPKAREVLKQEIRKSVTLDENGNFKVIDEKSNPIYGKNGKPITLEEWNERLISDYPFLAKDKVISGGNSNGGKPSRGNQDQPPAGLSQYDLTMWYANKEREKKANRS